MWWLGQLAQYPHLAQLFDRGIRDLKSLEGAERVSFECFDAAVVSYLWGNVSSALGGASGSTPVA